MLPTAFNPSASGVDHRFHSASHPTSTPTVTTTDGSHRPGFEQIPVELLMLITDRLDHRSASSLGEVDRQMYAVTRSRWGPRVERELEKARSEMAAMLLQLARCQGGQIRDRVSCLQQALELTSRIQLRFGAWLGPRDALPQRWDLLRLMLSEVEALTQASMLTAQPYDNSLQLGDARKLIAAVQAFLASAPPNLRVRGDPTLPDCPHLPVTRRMKAACWNLIRHHLRLEDVQMAGMVWIRSLTEALQTLPFQPCAVENLCFIASLWQHLCEHEYRLAPQFLGLLQTLLDPFPLEVRQAVAKEIEAAGRRWLTDSAKRQASAPTVRGSIEREQQQMQMQAQEIEDRTIQAMATVLS